MVKEIRLANGDIEIEDDSNPGGKTLSEIIGITEDTDDLSGTSFFLDEDDMASNDDTKVASQQSIKAYVDEQSTITTTIASSATPTPARGSIKTEYVITALAEAAEFGAPTGTPVNGDLLLITAEDDGTGRALTYNAIYDDPYSAEKPTTTTASKTLLMLFRYNSATSKWELLFEDEES